LRNQWFNLGRIGKAKGLKGEFVVTGRSDPLPPRLKTVGIGATPPGQIYQVASTRWQGSVPVLGLSEITDRDTAEKLRGSELWTSRDQVPLDAAKEYFWSDLIGLPVVDCDGKDVGTIESFENYGSSDIVNIKNLERRLALPLVSAYFDMDFREDSPVKLIVSLDLFDETWEDA
jgi:16S rRNA processing protein RimM